MTGRWWKRDKKAQNEPENPIIQPETMEPIVVEEQTVSTQGARYISDLTYEELVGQYGAPKEYSIKSVSPIAFNFITRDPIRNPKAYAIGKWLAKRKNKTKKSGKKNGKGKR